MADRTLAPKETPPNFMNRFIQQILRLVQFVVWHPYKTLIGTGVLTLLSFVIIQSLEVRANLMDLLPPKQPSVVELKRLEKMVGGTSFTVVTMESDEPKATEHFFDDLEKALSIHPNIRYLDGHPPKDFMAKNGLLYASLEELQKAAEEVERRIEKGKLKKANLFIDLGVEDESSPVDLSRLEQKFSDFFKPHRYYVSDDGRFYVLLIKPTGMATDHAFSKKFLGEVRAVIDQLNPKNYHPTLEVQLTGPYVSSLRGKETVTSDSRRSTLLSLAFMVIFLSLYFWRKRAVFLIAIPLVSGILWTLAFITLTIGSLNFVSSIASSILLGLGIDFGIHLFSEYTEQKKREADPEKAIMQTFAILTRPMLGAAATTCFAFFVMATSQFMGFQQFGLIAGSGIALCVLCMFTIFPAILILTERASPLSVDTKYLEEAHPMERSWVNFATSRKSLILNSVLLLICLYPIIVGHVRFDYNMNRQLGVTDLDGINDRVDKIFTNNINPEVALTESFEDSESMARAVRIAKNKNPMTRIYNSIALADFIPKNQEEKREIVARIRALFTPTVIHSLSDEEKKWFDRLSPSLNPGSINLGNLPENLLNKFTDLQGNQGRFFYIFPNFNLNEGKKFMEFVEEMQKIQCPDCEGKITFSGEPIVLYEVVQSIFKEGRYILIVSFIATLLFLLIRFRKLSATFAVLSPLVLGFVLMLGLMSIFGLKFTIMNLAFLGILVGMGIDYSIYLYERYVMAPNISIQEALRQVYRPILGTSLTTALGFGALLIGDAPGIRSIALLAVIGIAAITWLTLLWAPAFLAFIHPHKNAAEKK